MKMPRVSVGLPVYNGERYVRQALDSLLDQDFDDFEIVICDNASTDGTAEICRAYSAKDQRIRYFRNETNIGASPNYNRTFELARGQYFKWCAHDDRCHPNFLSRCVAVMDAAPPSVALVYPLCDVIGEFNEVLERASDRMLNRARHPHQRIAYVLQNVSWAYSLWGLVKSEQLRRTRLMAEGACNDYVLLVELSLCGEFLEVPEVLFQLRFHPGNAWGICTAEDNKAAWTNNKKANRRSRQSLLAWTDPKLAEKKLWLPFHEDLYFRYLKGVHHAHLPVFKKLLCYASVMAGYGRHLRSFGSPWKRQLLKILGRDRELTPVRDQQQ